MAVKSADLESQLIDTVCERIRTRLPDEQVGACETFTRQYYHWVPPEDLADRSALDLYGAAVAHWNLAQQRPPGQVKVHVYNPEFEHHGWQSPHTVVEIVSDDMPFIVDSVTMELGRQGYGIDLVIHPVMRVRRDAEGDLLDVLEPGAPHADSLAESILHVEVAREPDQTRLLALRDNLRRVLEEVRVAVEDWQPMRARAIELAEQLSGQATPVSAEELAEVRAFLQWMANEHFTFLGYREYDLVIDDGQPGLKAVPDSGLGILRQPASASFTKLSAKAVGAGSGHGCARADQGQLARHRAPSGLPRLHRREEVQRSGTGHRRVPFPRPVHRRRLPRQPTHDPAAARQGRRRSAAGRVPSRQP